MRRLQPRRCVRNGTVVGPHAGCAAPRRARTSPNREPRTGSGQDTCRGTRRGTRARRRRLAARLLDAERREDPALPAAGRELGRPEAHGRLLGGRLHAEGRDEAGARHASRSRPTRGWRSRSGSSTSRRCRSPSPTSRRSTRSRCARSSPRSSTAIPDEERVIALDRVLAQRRQEPDPPEERRGREGGSADDLLQPDARACSSTSTASRSGARSSENDLKFAVNTNWDLFQHEPTKTFYLRDEKSWLKATRRRRAVDAGRQAARELHEAAGRRQLEGSQGGAARARARRDSDAEGVRQHDAGGADPARRARRSTCRSRARSSSGSATPRATSSASGRPAPVYYLVAGPLVLGAGLQRARGRSPRRRCRPTSRRFRSSTRARACSRRCRARSRPPKPCCSRRCRRRRASTGRSSRRRRSPTRASRSSSRSSRPRVARAVNTDKDIIKVGDLYYMCFQGVWFMSTSADRPVGSRRRSVPKEIYEIPVSSPAHNVTYVTVVEDDATTTGSTFAAVAGYTGHDGRVGLRGVGQRLVLPAVLRVRRLLSRTTTRATRPTATAPGTTRGPALRPRRRGVRTVRRRRRRRALQPAHRHVCARRGGVRARTARAARRRRTTRAPAPTAQTRQGSNVYGSWGTTAVQRGDELGADRARTPTADRHHHARDAGRAVAAARSRARARSRQRRRRADRQRRRLRRPRRQRLPQAGRRLAEVRQRQLEQRRQADAPIQRPRDAGPQQTTRGVDSSTRDRSTATRPRAARPAAQQRLQQLQEQRQQRQQPQLELVTARAAAPVAAAADAEAAAAGASVSCVVNWTSEPFARLRLKLDVEAEVRDDRRKRAPRRGAPREGSLEEVGPLPERAPVGHRARGLQRRTATPGTTSPTTRRARAPTAGARTASPGSRDDQQRLCFALALWNGADPILKERLFGLTNSEGNHGEDVKEYYFYLDSTPTHSYMKYLYKYPQAAFPYDDLVRTNRERGAAQRAEYELLDTGVFDEDRYFDVFVEYAKAAPEDVLIRITVQQPRPGGGRRCTCCRPSGSATPGRGRRPPARGRSLRARSPGRERSAIAAQRRELGDALPAAPKASAGAPLHRERDERRAPVRPAERDALRQGRHSTTTSVDGRDERRQPGAARDEGGGPLPLDGRGRRKSRSLRLRLREEHGRARRSRAVRPTSTRSFAARRREADEFYAHDHPARRSARTRRA